VGEGTQREKAGDEFRGAILSKLGERLFRELGGLCESKLGLPDPSERRRRLGQPGPGGHPILRARRLGDRQTSDLSCLGDLLGTLVHVGDERGYFTEPLQTARSVDRFVIGCEIEGALEEDACRVGFRLIERHLAGSFEPDRRQPGDSDPVEALSDLIGQGRRLIQGLLEVAAERRGEGRPLVSGGLLEPARQTNVKTCPLRPGERRIPRIPQEGVPVSMRRSEQLVEVGGFDEHPGGQHGEARFGLFDPELVERSVREPTTGDTCPPSNLAGRLGQVVELSLIDVVHRGGHLDLHRWLHQSPGARLIPREQADAGPQPQQLLNEQGVAVGAICDGRDHIVGESATDQRSDQLHGVRLG
jgi:hypothetical protein